ncbi:PilW family protein [Pseudomonas putida]|uniref:Prepilin-type N-terminal cleavage/methylation domain-containing protein n=1 Tax=Pseudomonas putida TaxID=303 RepID=A0A6I6XSU8_PSEPU|nr:prepilin-type N-terminal cleavage/methylation domain-containing protein [Pseudomonas putida]QHG67133.1 prepilin-type N-terminal cleavage/methylation domain-containing protein [Pseudomonas putida]
MKRMQVGFGLLEVMLALAIGLVVLVAASQLFVSAHQTWRLQGAALRLQDDARLALLRMAQDIRMAGMFGCLRLKPGDFIDPLARQAFSQPLVIGASSLELVVAESSGYTGKPDWTLLTDCREEAVVFQGPPSQTGTVMTVRITRHRYELRGSILYFTRGKNSQAQPLASHVSEMQVTQVDAPEGGRVDLQLTLFEPTLQLEQRHELSVALRNPVSIP